MRDERVAELMKQSVAGKEPREGWDQRVLAVAAQQRPRRWWLVLAFAPVPLIGLVFYVNHQRLEERAQQQNIIEQQTRARLLAEQQAKELQKQLAGIEQEISDLESQHSQAKTEAERKRIEQRMRSVLGSAGRRGQAHSSGPKVQVGGGDSADPLQGIK